EILFVFFFFQAEDGIRDLTVTGVQTCALPIFRQLPRHAHRPPELGTGLRLVPRLFPHRVLLFRPDTPHLERPLRRVPRNSIQPRSEERRVGKECRCGWAPNHYKKEKLREELSI